jgi:hypothetical protein
MARFFAFKSFEPFVPPYRWFRKGPVVKKPILSGKWFNSSYHTPNKPSMNDPRERKCYPVIEWSKRYLSYRKVSFPSSKLAFTLYLDMKRSSRETGRDHVKYGKLGAIANKLVIENRYLDFRATTPFSSLGDNLCVTRLNDDSV